MSEHVVYLATNQYGGTCYFGEHSAARAWAKETGTVEEKVFRLGDVRLVATDELASQKREHEATLATTQHWLANLRSAEAELTRLRAENATLQRRVEQMERAATDFLDNYVAMINSGDCGNWDPETEPKVIALRAALAGET